MFIIFLHEIPLKSHHAQRASLFAQKAVHFTKSLDRHSKFIKCLLSDTPGHDKICKHELPDQKSRCSSKGDVESRKSRRRWSESDPCHPKAAAVLDPGQSSPLLTPNGLYIMYVCAYIYIYICICVCVHINVNIYINIMAI